MKRENVSFEDARGTAGWERSKNLATQREYLKGLRVFLGLTATCRSNASKRWISFRDARGQSVTRGDSPCQRLPGSGRSSVTSVTSASGKSYPHHGMRLVAGEQAWSFLDQWCSRGRTIPEQPDSSPETRAPLARIESRPRLIATCDSAVNYINYRNSNSRSESQGRNWPAGKQP